MKPDRHTVAGVLASGSWNADGTVRANYTDGNWVIRKTGTGRYWITATAPGARVTAGFASATVAVATYVVAPVIQGPADIEFWVVSGATQADIGAIFTIFGFLP